ncbi:MAG: helix-turn-helix transcriptional regulator [Cyanobacteria bacterium SIG32]|nr:helix-turn-helix transcriptional regulator [Cyanobacteria bacterium SIG32]
MSSSILKKFANKLIAIRKDRNLSQEDLALLCDIDRTYVGRIETLKRNPSLIILNKIAEGLGIKLSELLDFKD